MGVYLKKFETTAAYTAALPTIIRPNVSLIAETRVVAYNPSTPPTPVETRVVATFNVTDTSNPTSIGFSSYTSGFSAIEIDGVEQPSVVSAYTFDTVGEHTVKYTLTDSTTIGEGAFYDCTSLTTIDIPSGVTSIGQYTFYGCSSLTSCTIGSGVTSIGEGAFYSCSGLTSIVIPDSVISIGGFAFQSCSGLTSCTIGSGVTSIGDDAFAWCVGLTSIVMPSGVTYIGNQSFRYCSGLTSITIEATVPPTLGDDAFNSTNNCPIYVPSGSVEAYKSASGWSGYASRIQAIS